MAAYRQDSCHELINIVLLYSANLSVGNFLLHHVLDRSQIQYSCLSVICLSGPHIEWKIFLTAVPAMCKAIDKAILGILQCSHATLCHTLLLHMSASSPSHQAQVSALQS